MADAGRSKGSPQFTLRVDYPPFPIQTGAQEFSRLLEQIEVHGVSAVEYRCAARWSMPRRKVNSDVILLIVAGLGQISIDERDYRISPGHLVHVAPGASFSAINDPADPLQFLLVHAKATIAGAIPLSGILGFPDLFPVGTGHAIRELLSETCRECALQPPGWERASEALVLRVLLNLIREFAALLAPVRNPRAMAAISRMLPAIEGMRADLASPLPMTELAQRCELSEPQFRRIFRQVFGCAPVTYLQQLRIEEACRLLRQRNVTIERISHLVGYTEPACFHRTFVRLVGLTPGRWREQAL
jgi:AraC-like DNA-binding protein/quercetin dioxygenase-like cupin family protein